MSRCKHSQRYFTKMCVALAEANLMPTSRRGNRALETSRTALEAAILQFLETSDIASSDQPLYLSSIFSTGSHAILSMALARFSPEVREVDKTLADTAHLCRRADPAFLCLAARSHIQTPGLFAHLCKRVVRAGEDELRACVIENLQALDKVAQLDWVFDFRAEHLHRQPDFLADLTRAQFARMPLRASYMLKTALMRRRGAHALFFKLCGADLQGRTDIPKATLQRWTGMSNHELAKILGSSSTPAGFLSDLDALARADDFLAIPKPS